MEALLSGRATIDAKYQMRMVLWSDLRHSWPCLMPVKAPETKGAACRCCGT